MSRAIVLVMVPQNYPAIHTRLPNEITGSAVWWIARGVANPWNFDERFAVGALLARPGG